MYDPTGKLHIVHADLSQSIARLRVLIGRSIGVPSDAVHMRSCTGILPVNGALSSTDIRAESTIYTWFPIIAGSESGQSESDGDATENDHSDDDDAWEYFEADAKLSKEELQVRQATMSYMSTKPRFNTFVHDRGKKLLVVSWNINGWTARVRAALHVLIHQRHPDIIAIQEGYVQYAESMRSEDANKCVIKGYTAYSTEFAKCVTLVRHGVQHERLPIGCAQDKIADDAVKAMRVRIHGDPLYPEYRDARSGWLMSRLYAVAIRVYSTKRDVQCVIINHYRPQQGEQGGCSPENLQNAIAALQAIPRLQRHQFVCVADINAHNPLWMRRESKSSEAKKVGVEIRDWIIDHNWQVLTDGSATRIGVASDGESITRTAPDIIMAGPKFDVDKSNCWQENFGITKLSDHLPQFLLISSASSFIEDVPDQFVIKNGDDADWEGWKSKMEVLVGEWRANGGDRLRAAVDEYVAWNATSGIWDDAHADSILLKYELNRDDIREMLMSFITTTVAMSREHFGSRRLPKPGETRPWITNQMKKAWHEWEEWRDRYHSRSRSKRRRLKKEFIRRENEIARLFDAGCDKWIRQIMEKHGHSTSLTMRQMSNLFKYNSKGGGASPCWKNKKGDIIASNSREQCQKYQGEAHHRFESWDWDEREDDDEIDAELKAFKNERKNRVSDAERQQYLKNLSAPISIEEIKKAVRSSDANSATYDDEFSYKYFKQYDEIAEDVLYGGYNGVWLFKGRPVELNESTCKLAPKPGRPLDDMFSYRPITLQSCFAKPLDAIVATRYLSYGIRTKVISSEHFGFVRGVSTKEAVLYLLDGIWSQLRNGRSAHLLLFDFKSAFDTVEQKPFVDSLSKDFGITGHARDFFVEAFRGRRGRVCVNGCYSDWQPNPCGLGQGWPPAAIAFIFSVTDFEVVKRIKLRVRQPIGLGGDDSTGPKECTERAVSLGIRMPCFADDTSVCNDGSTSGALLERQMNRVIECVSYISHKKRLILEATKQKYMVLSYGTDEEHRAEYLDLVIDGQRIKREYECVRVLGVHIDRRLCWAPHIKMMLAKVRGAYMTLYQRYRCARSIDARWMPQLMESFVLSRMAYFADVWSTASKAELEPVRKMYNQMVRLANGSSLSASIDFECMQLNWPNFENWAAAQRASLFTRLIRTPSSSALHDCVARRWSMWLGEREDDDERLWRELDSDTKYGRKVEGIDCFNDIEVIDGYASKAQDNIDDFERRDRDDEAFDDPTAKRLKRRDITAIDRAFQQAAEWGTSDYVVMKGVAWTDIPKRVSYTLVPHAMPVNAKWELRKDDEDTGFTRGWLAMYVKEIYKVDEKRVWVIMTDGSVKEFYGGAGFYACKLEHYDKIDYEALREARFKAKNITDDALLEAFNESLFASKLVARRASIEFCELEAVAMMLRLLIEHLEAQTAEGDIPEVISVSIDSCIVLEWLAGECHNYDKLVYDKLTQIYDLIRELQRWDIKTLWSWVHAHNSEPLNENADILAKVAMMNARFTASWGASYQTAYDRREWTNYGEKAAKKECKRRAIEATRREWRKACVAKTTEIENGIVEEAEVCSRYLLKWKISASMAYKEDRKGLRRFEWERLAALRSGHTTLNGEVKFGAQSKSCPHRQCRGAREDVIHFLLRCPKYAEGRKDMIEEVDRLYRYLKVAMDAINGGNFVNAWNGAGDEGKLKALLFPVQKEIQKAALSCNNKALQRLLEHRKDVLGHLMDYISGTRRWQDRERQWRYFDL